MAKNLGLERIVWAPGIIGKDVTDGHIDAVARFVEPGHVLVQMPSKTNPRDPFDRAAAQTYEILKSARDARGRKFEVSVVYDPDYRKIRSSSHQFVASSANYVLVNGAVLLANFGDDRADASAYELLGSLYPGRAVIHMNVDALGDAGGGIHCVTNHQPAFQAHEP
jgi:agmatine deiminase